MNFTHHPHDADWLHQQLARIPEDFHHSVQAKYSTLFTYATHQGEGRRTANNFMLDAVEQFAMTSRKRLVLHEHNAQLAGLQVQLFDLETAAQWAHQQGVTVPRFPTVEANLDPHKRHSREAVSARLCNPHWWEKQLTKQYRRTTEAAQIRAGNVCKGTSPYVSNLSLEAFTARQEATEAWKKQAVLISNEGDEISLDASAHTHDAAFIQFAEFMVRVNGMSALANDTYLSDDAIALLPDSIKTGNGGTLEDVPQLAALATADALVGICFTLTTPSRFHRYRTRNNGTLELNKRYDRSKTPADARDWLQETWKLTQTAWKRKTKHIQPIQGFGFRMDESHHDGVSHYHYAIWVKGSDAQRATEIFYNKALRGAYTDRVKQRNLCQYGATQDATERGATARRLNFKIMTSAKGMVSYMVKYITKGLTGADWQDLKAGISSNDTILNLMARKSVWGLRQYAFWNAPSVMAWRELRRMNEVIEDADFEAARLAAKASDWKAFTELNGGATCSARQRPLRLLRKVRQTYADSQTLQGETALNAYGEVIEQVCGIARGQVEQYTRMKDWYLLNIGSLKQLLIDRYTRESGSRKADLPPTFSDDIQAVIDQAKAQGKLTRLAERAGVVLFEPPPTAATPGDLSPLGLVGITSHAMHDNNTGLSA